MFTSTMYTPNLKLSKWIGKYWFLEAKSKKKVFEKKLIFSDACSTIVFILKGEVKLGAFHKETLTQGIYVVPPILESHYDEMSSDIFLIDICLNPGVFYKLFNFPIEQMESKIYTFTELLIDFDEDILRNLVINQNNKSKLVMELDKFFMNLFHRRDFKKDIFLSSIIDLYKHGNFEEFVNNSDLSLRQLQRKVKYITGLSPKKISRIGRFNIVLESISNEKNILNFANIAFNNNYSDQSHFIKDFKYFTRTSPKKFLEKSQDYLQYKAIQNIK